MTFDQFWAEYPRKVAKGTARKTWEKLEKKKILPPTEKILKSLAWQKKKWTDPQFIPHPSTWLNGERWEDEPVVSTSTSRPRPQEIEREEVKPVDPSKLRELGRQRFGDGWELKVKARLEAERLEREERIRKSYNQLNNG